MKTLKIKLMKTVFLSLFASITCNIWAQQSQLVLIEQITSASCPNCANQNPAFDKLLEENASEIVVVKYQRGGGNYIDPMWDFNPIHADSRADFYSEYAFPQVWINGSPQGNPRNVTQTTIDSYIGNTSPFQIDLSKSLNNTKDMIHVEVSIEALADLQDTEHTFMRVYVVVIEKDVNYDIAPGTNGEKHFRWVMRKFLNGSYGYYMGAQEKSDTTFLEYDYTIDATEIDAEDLEVICFVQSSSTKEVYQAAKTESRTTSISDIQPTTTETIFSIYPSIADQSITVQLNSEFQGENRVANIYNLLGNKVKTVPIRGVNTNIDLNTLIQGHYWIEINHAGTRYAKRFLKVD